MQVAGSLQDSFLVVVLRRFDECVNSQLPDACHKRPELIFVIDMYMAYYNEDILRYKQARDDILGDSYFSSAKMRQPRSQTPRSPCAVP